MKNLKYEIKDKISKNSSLLKKINTLVKFADAGINYLSLNEISEKNFNFPEDIPESVKNQIISENKHAILGHHTLFENNTSIGETAISFENESQGVNALFALGGKMIDIIENGGTLFVDELETSFHPYLSKLLISLFQNERINTKNAQLIFTTHDITLLDRTVFRKDQIWFTEKDEFGSTELFSLQNFNDVREDTPFDKWYMIGKFGGVPNIKSVESLFFE